MAPLSTLDGEEFPFQAMPWKIASFDLDGTLVRGTSSGAQPARAMLRRAGVRACAGCGCDRGPRCLLQHGTQRKTRTVALACSVALA